MNTLTISKSLVAFVFIASCNSNYKQDPSKVNDDSLSIITESPDSSQDVSYGDILFDTIGVSESPIQVLSAKFAEDDYSSYKDVLITFRNVSKKNISGVKFKWYGVNVFGEPASFIGGGFIDGFGGGYTDHIIRPGEKRTSEWDGQSRDGKKILKAWPYEIVFEDGSKWKSESKK